MLDVVFVAATIAFFALAAAYVRGCARIVGDDAAVGLDTDVGLDVADGDSSPGESAYAERGATS